jgi:uncharacterized protein (TIGR03000 family)
MTRRWIAAAAALALMLGHTQTSRAIGIIIPFGLGNPVFGYGYPGFGYGGWGYYPGGIGFNYYPLAYGAYNPPFGRTWYSGWAANPYYNGYNAALGAQSMYPGFGYSTALAPMSYVAYASPGSSALLPATFTTPEQPAHVEVHVPDDAQLWFDGQRTTQTGSERFFHTPPLEKGKSYHYDVRARWVQDGRTFDQTQEVAVYAGGQVSVTFPNAR